MAKIREYQGGDITVQYDVKRCIHAKACVHGLPAVFNSEARPWVQPDHAPADAVASVIERCPTGALHYQRADRLTERADAVNSVLLAVNGPLYMRGDVEIVSHDGGSIVLRDTRVALCRCGSSANKPFCDNTHLQNGFTAADTLESNGHLNRNAFDSPVLRVTLRTNGPLRVDGTFQLKDQDGNVIDAGNQAVLCRCGASAHKPFCDGTHQAINFTTEPDPAL
ncbi:MAG: CDGSH iron-sulfur domain-containing protein [bacterium]|nr:CDGSH iron-sulfur domain-containing protein [bacterium]